MESRNRFELLSDEDCDPGEISRGEEIPKMTPKQDSCGQEAKNSNQESKKYVSKKGKKAAATVAAGGNGDIPKKKENENVKGAEPAIALDSGKTAGGDSDPENDNSWTEYVARKKTKAYRGRGSSVTRPIGDTLSRPREGKREFDRQSGNPKSCVKPVVKRRGGGARNWGRPNDNLEATKDVPEDGGDEILDTSEARATKDVPEDGCDEILGTSEARATKDVPEDGGYEILDTSEARATKDVPEDFGDEILDTSEARAEGDAISVELQELTFEEFRLKQKAARSIPEHKLRKPGEGEDTSQWASLCALKKKNIDDTSGSVAETTHGRHRAHHKPLAKTLDVSFAESTSRIRGTLRHSVEVPKKKILPTSAHPSASQEGSDIPLAQNQEPAPKLDNFDDFPSLNEA